MITHFCVLWLSWLDTEIWYSVAQILFAHTASRVSRRLPRCSFQWDNA
jgi:hypothetical protein